jgi:hypothetical protein
MTLLYRTPNIVIDEFEFHATVETCRGAQPRRHFRWRMAGRREMWRRLSDFKGHPPKARVLGAKFAPFKRHMLQAERSVS